MASSRPSIDDLFLASRKETSVPTKPSIDDLFVQSRNANTQPKKSGALVKTNPYGKGFALAGPMGDLNASAEALPMIGGMAGPLGAGVGELAKQGVRQLTGTRNSKPRKLLGVGPMAPGIVNDVVGAVGGTYVGNKVFDAGSAVVRAGARKLAPYAKDAGIRIAQNIIRPTGRFAKRGADIAETALKTGSLRSSAQGTMEAAQGQIDDLMNQVDELASKSDKSVTAEDSLRRIDALSKWYRKRGDTASADRVLQIKKDLIENTGIVEPVFQDVERGQFVMNVGKQVKPKLSVSQGVDEIPASLRGKKRFESVRTDSGKFGRSEPKREILTPQKYVDNPDDVVALNIPKDLKNKTPQTIVTAGPETTYQLRGGIKGPSIKERVLVGSKPRQLSVKRALELRREQDALLKSKKIDGGYKSDTSSPEILTRQEYAGGLRREYGKAEPEIAAKNKLISSLIDVASVAKNRSSVSSRNNLADIMDTAIGAGAVVNPKLTAALVAKKLYQGGKAGIAKSLYSVGSPAKKAGRSVIRRLALQEGGRRLLSQN